MPDTHDGSLKGASSLTPTEFAQPCLHVCPHIPLINNNNGQPSTLLLSPRAFTLGPHRRRGPHIRGPVVSRVGARGIPWCPSAPRCRCSNPKHPTADPCSTNLCPSLGRSVLNSLLKLKVNHIDHFDMDKGAGEGIVDDILGGLSGSFQNAVGLNAAKFKELRIEIKRVLTAQNLKRRLNHRLKKSKRLKRRPQDSFRPTHTWNPTGSVPSVKAMLKRRRSFPTTRAIKHISF